MKLQSATHSLILWGTKRLFYSFPPCWIWIEFWRTSCQKRSDMCENEWIWSWDCITSGIWLISSKEKLELHDILWSFKSIRSLAGGKRCWERPRSLVLIEQVPRCIHRKQWTFPTVITTSCEDGVTARSKAGYGSVSQNVSGRKTSGHLSTRNLYRGTESLIASS